MPSAIPFCNSQNLKLIVKMFVKQRQKCLFYDSANFCNIRLVKLSLGRQRHPSHVVFAQSMLLWRRLWVMNSQAPLLAVFLLFTHFYHLTLLVHRIRTRTSQSSNARKLERGRQAEKIRQKGIIVKIVRQLGEKIECSRIE